MLNKERKKKKKSHIRKLILENSIKIFSDKGFDGTSMRDIAKAGGITLPTIYYYFGNKEGLYNAVFQEIYKKFSKELTISATGIEGIQEKLIARGMAKYEFMKKNREMMILYLRELYNPNSFIKFSQLLLQGIKTFEILIREGIKRGELREIDPNLAGWYLMGISNIFDIKMANSSKLPSKEEIISIVELTLNGLIKK